MKNQVNKQYKNDANISNQNSITVDDILKIVDLPKTKEITEFYKPEILEKKISLSQKCEEYFCGVASNECWVPLLLLRDFL